MTHLEGRIVQLELAIGGIQDQVLRLIDAVNQLRTEARSSGFGGGGSGGGAGWVGVATTAISAMVGIVPGSGTVAQGQLSGGNLVATGSSFTVYNASTTTNPSGNGIDSGQHVWVQADQFGTLWVGPLECS